MDISSNKVIRTGTSKSFELEHRATGFIVFPCCVSVFLNNALIFILEWQCMFCVIVCWKYLICPLILQGVAVKRLLGVSEKSLDF